MSCDVSPVAMSLPASSAAPKQQTVPQYTKQELTIISKRDPVLCTSLGDYDLARLHDSTHLQFLVHHLLLSCNKRIKPQLL